MRMNSVAVVVELGPAVALKSCKPKSYLLPLFKEPFLCDIYAPRNRKREREKERERERERERGGEGGREVPLHKSLTTCIQAASRLRSAHTLGQHVARKGDFVDWLTAPSASCFASTGIEHIALGLQLLHRLLLP